MTAPPGERSIASERPIPSEPLASPDSPFPQQAEVMRFRWTRKRYEQIVEHGILGEDDHVELLAGEIFSVSPQNSAHAAAMLILVRLLQALIGPDFHVRPQLPLALGADSMPEPDIAVVPGAPEDYWSAHPTTAVLIIEIAESSLASDRRRKGSIYARAGIEDYWIFNLVNLRLEVYRQPAEDADAPTGYAYQERTVYGAGDTIVPLAFPNGGLAVRDFLPKAPAQRRKRERKPQSTSAAPPQPGVE